MSSYGYEGSFGRTPLSSLRSGIIVRADFAAIERFIADNIESKVKVAEGMDLLVRSMALVIKGFAQEKSGGPIAPNQRSVPALAYRIPVQRITGAYFAGWAVRRLGTARWLVYNDAKEAFLIETGLYQRVRRPILKMSLISMLRFLEASRTEQRFLDWVIAPRRDAKGRYAKIPFPSRFVGTETTAAGMGYLSTYSGSRSGKVARIGRNVMAGPKARLPR